MPNLMIQLEQSFEPFVERLDRLAAAGIQAFSAMALEVFPALKSALMLLVARCRRYLRAMLTAATILGTEKSSARAAVFFIVFDPFAEAVAVVAAVGKYVVRFFVKIIDFLVESAKFFRAGGIRRSQGQRALCVILVK